ERIFSWVSEASGAVLRLEDSDTSTQHAISNTEVVISGNPLIVSRALTLLKHALSKTSTHEQQNLNSY
ncbi:hypothetical protein MXB_1888, partial [Myxobolus squamalis]